MSYISTKDGFNDDGKSKSVPMGYNLFSADLGIGWAPSKWMEIGASLPYYSGRESFAEGQNLGDLSAYGLFRLFQSKDLNKELAGQLRISFPTGNPSRYLTIQDDIAVPENLTTGDPSVNFFPAILGRWTFGKFAVRGLAEYGLRESGDIKYGLEGLDETRNFKPGDSLLAEAELLFQLNTRFVLIGSLNYYQQTANELNHKSLHDTQEIFSFSPGIEFQLNRDYDLFLNAGIPIFGRNYANGYPLNGGLEGRF